MNGPTAPTKPTPPTPPVIDWNPSGKASDIQSPTSTTPTTSTTPNSINPSKTQTPVTGKDGGSRVMGGENAQAKTSSLGKSAPAMDSDTSTAEGNKAFPAMVNGQQETSSQTVAPSSSPVPNNKSAATVFSFLFILVAIAALVYMVVRMRKNHQPRQKTIIDYSAENPKEIIDLITSPIGFESVPETMAKSGKKPKITSNFEIKI